MFSNKLNEDDFSENDLNNGISRHDESARNSEIPNGIERKHSKIKVLKAQISKDAEEAEGKWKPFKDIRWENPVRVTDRKRLIRTRLIRSST